MNYMEKVLYYKKLLTHLHLEQMYAIGPKNLHYVNPSQEAHSYLFINTIYFKSHVKPSEVPSLIGMDVMETYGLCIDFQPKNIVTIYITGLSQAHSNFFNLYIQHMKQTFKNFYSKQDLI